MSTTKKKSQKTERHEAGIPKKRTLKDKRLASVRITQYELFYDLPPRSDEEIIAAIREAYLEGVS